MAVVTGAGSGIGAAVARRFAERGVAVALVGRTPEKLEAVAREISATGGIAHPVPADLAERDAPAAVTAEVLAALGRIDVVVNNAGTASLTPLEDVTVEQFDREFAVNVRAALLLVQAALPALRRSEGAAVVNVSSAAAWLYRPGQAVYGGSKTALEYLTRSLAAELAPGRIQSELRRPRPGRHADPRPGRRRRRRCERLPRPHDPARPDGDPRGGRLVDRPAHRAEASWVTGAVLHVDGGRSRPTSSMLSSAT